MSRRKQAVPARITDLTKGGKEVLEVPVGERISDVQEMGMVDHIGARVSTRETRNSSYATSSTPDKEQKTKDVRSSPLKTAACVMSQQRKIGHSVPQKGYGGRHNISGSPKKTERPGLRRTQRKNAAQRYKLGKIAAAEESRMIGAELRSKRRRSTEGKGKIVASRKTKSTVDISRKNSQAILTSELVNASKLTKVNDPVIYTDLITPVSSSSHRLQAPASPSCWDGESPPSAESDQQALGTASPDCQKQSETGDVCKLPLPSSESSRTGAASLGSEAHHQSGDADDEALGAGGVRDDVVDGVSTPEEVEAESVPSDSSSGEKNYKTVTGGNNEGMKGDKPMATSNSEKALFKRRRPMEEGNTCLTCPVCSLDFVDKHGLTMHFREHNSTSTTIDGGTMHSCKLCGKKLSSTSSLDRHMLIHSGERPHRCPLCPMTFTTNGNMRRHVRTHEKGGGGAPTEGEYVTETAYSKPRKRLPTKRLLDPGDAENDASPLKCIAYIDDKDSPIKVRVRDDELTCPICNKAFLCHYGLQTHMELHPNIIIKCNLCEATFKNNRGLRMHVLMSHKKAMSPGKMSVMTSDVPLGFQDLGSVADISCDKFPLIAQVWCEKNARRCNSVVHRFICPICTKAFPCASALALHKSKHASKAGVRLSHFENKVKENPSTVEVAAPIKNKKEEPYLPPSPPTQEQFMATLQLRPNPSRISAKHPDHHVPLLQIATPANMLPSRKCQVMNDVKADRDFAEVGKILTLASVSSNPLLMLKQLNRGMKHSPSKGSALSSTSTTPALSKFKTKVGSATKPPTVNSSEQLPTHVRQADHEPRSGDQATEMHFPTEVARDECIKTEEASPKEGTSSEVGQESETTEADNTTEESSSKDGKPEKSSKYTCKYCQDTFAQYSALKIHMRSHMGLTPFKCLLCEYSSADKSTLVRHMRTHSGERPYSCKLCDFPFTTKANCERHIKKRHGKESKMDIEVHITYNSSADAVASDMSSPNRFRAPETLCKLCNREFRFFRDLQNHLKVHQKTPSKPFSCLKCQTGFSSKNNCSRHITKCHPDVSKDDLDNFMIVKDVTKIADIDQKMANSFASNGEQLSPIDFSRKSPLVGCDPELSDQSWLTAYTLPMLTDLDAPIDLSLPKNKRSSFIPPMDSTFGRLRFKRVYHKFYSKALDALVCPHCSQSFTHGSIFKNHIRSHTMERPHRCYYCKAAFTMKDSLDKHIERRHGEESKSESPAQSFIPKVATPMQFKLMSRLSQGLRIHIDSLEDDNHLEVDDNKVRQLQSPEGSFGSDASGELASVSRILAASSNNFQVCFPPASGGQVHEEGHNGMLFGLDEQEMMVTGNDFLVHHSEANEDRQELTDDLALSEEYNLIIDESLASSTPKVEYDKEEPHGKAKERTAERDRSNLPTKEMCPYCNRKFPWISSLRRHILTHTGLKPFQCPLCDSSFSTKSNCERHIVRRHCLNVTPGAKVPELPFTCLEGCEDCAFSTKLKLMKHYEVRHVGVTFPERYKNEVRKLPASVIRNALAKRASKLGMTRSFGNTEFKSRVGSSGVTLKLTRYKGFGKKRNVSVGEEKPLALIKRMPSEDDGKPNQLHLKKKHRLSIKGKSFPLVFKKKKKKKMHAALEKYGSKLGLVKSMSTDGTSTGSNPALDLSIRSSNLHIEESFSYIANRSGDRRHSHKKKSKRRNARHCCDHCCKRFKSATTLKRHYRVHTLEHPFRCVECAASFTTKFNCQRHMLKLHGKTKEESVNLVERMREAATDPTAVTLNELHHLEEPTATEVELKPFHVYNVSDGLPNPDIVGDLQSGIPAVHVIEATGTEVTRELADSMTITESNQDKLEEDCKNSKPEHKAEVVISNPKENTDSPMKAPLGTGNSCSTVEATPTPTDVQDHSLHQLITDGSRDNTDIIQNLLGIQDSSVLDKMLDSADSAARLLGVD